MPYWKLTQKPVRQSSVFMIEQQQQSKPSNTLVSEVVIENVGPKQSACLSLRRHLGRRLSFLVLTQVMIRMMSMILMMPILL